MRMAFVTMCAALAVAGAAAQTIYPTNPDWISSDVSSVSTGGALVDLNKDGWLDLVVSNGNDMAQQRVAVYYNRGDGTFPQYPNWQSADNAYNGHLDVADVNGDGWPDVAVAYLGEFGTTGPIARVYLNNGGTLSSSPNWSANVQGNAFGVDFGDMNGDGRPDLAIATGWPYSNPNAYYNYVYLNVNGQLAATPSWVSADKRDYDGVLWVDADRDGWLDLAMCGCNNDTWIYRNLGGVLETTASWHTTDNTGQYAIMMATGDVTGDGRRDLFVTDNTQLYSGSGKFRQYNGQPAGYFSTTPNWFYYNSNHRYGSAVALADVNADGDLDLATGAWWSKSRLFLNTGSGFGSSPDWTSGPSSVVEKICFGDIDRNGLYLVYEVFPTEPDEPSMFYLARRPVEQVVEVRRNGTPLEPHEYTYSADEGWISAAAGAGYLQVWYRVSSRPDMAITNWDNNIGNYVYYNRLVTRGDANCDGTLDGFDIQPFVLLLTDPNAYAAEYFGCDGPTFCDMNNDGSVDGFDIQPFVEELTG